jgi:predicted metal-dependent peptidase
MNPTPADIIAAARMQTHNRHPYLSTALFSLRPHPAPGLGTMAVDAGWRLYYDPVTVVQWYEEERAGLHDGPAGVIFHELGHVLRKHMDRRGDRDPVAANMAMDREINDDVIAAGWKLPGEPLLPEQIGMESGLLFEEYYTKDKQNRDEKRGKQPQPSSVPGCGGKCGGCAGNPTEWEQQNAGSEGAPSAVPQDGPPDGSAFSPGEGESGSPSPPIPDPVSSLEQEIALRKVALDTIAHAKAKGSVPGGLKAWAEAAILPPKVDWRQRLRGLARQAIASVAGASDFTWRRMGRRSAYAAGRVGWPLAPALHQPVPKVALVLDTSGSMSMKGESGRTLLEEAASEVLGIVQAAGGDVFAVACDAGVHAQTKLRRAADIEKLNKGGGGTNVRPGFEAVRKWKPDIVVICTDAVVGDDWPTPEDCRGVRVLAAVVGDGGDVPPHIMCVRVDE